METKMTRYEELQDEEVVFLAQNGDSYAMEYLLNKYKNLVRSRAYSYFLVGSDRDDIMQEGMIGLYKSVRDYRADRLASFRGFAELCITRQILTAIKMATRQKHIPLNSYVSLSKPVYDDDSGKTQMDTVVSSGSANPENMVINQENYAHMEERIRGLLSDMEKEVLDLYLQGKSYQEISAISGRHTKSIDNALQRIKKKLEKFLLPQEDAM